ncbi:MAG: type IV secretory system conjugative DNA transfer family protein [Oscillospiraceae bacterium]|nr:type IV secretory system conjugative DNA transfer family protein [Oscillospiraceae bacterium]MDY3792869.1 type IV secretory system conjugative DNA transfer family protein [Oscillospiraceae bacterium]MDY6207539.1 type IV secretory system conjugative DNA transfer family protein [Oscillospiraceae bacterium]
MKKNYESMRTVCRNFNFEPYDDFEYEELIIPDDRFAQSEMLIARNCRYSLDDAKTRLNNNVLIVGGSGTGKTSTIVIPNLRQAVGSYIVSDPKGNLCKKYGKYLCKQGYEVYNIDFTKPENSAHYNPLRFIRTTQDILNIASVITNEKASVGTKADPFWDSMTIILLSAIIGYMLETNFKPFNFSGILRLVREGERIEDDSKDSRLSHRFRDLKMQNPDSWACAQFSDVDQAPNKTYDCIRATLSSKLSKFDTEELQMMMSGNDFTFASIGSVKKAVFVTVSDTDRSMDSLANIFFTQAMHQLCRFADETENSRLPVPVRFILDDFATNCRIEEFPRMISSIRSRGISVMLMIQSEAQLSQSYDADRMTIIANCDTYVYLGGNDYDTAEAVGMRCNKPAWQVLYMPVGSCWVFRRGSQPVFTEILPPDSREMPEREPPICIEP